MKRSKIITLFILVLLLVSNVSFALGVTLFDSYIDTQDTSKSIKNEHPSGTLGPSAIGQTILVGPIDVVLDSVGFYLKKIGSPTSNLVCTVYAHTGTFGSSGTPTGAALATSATKDSSGLTTSYVMNYFNFTEANRITLEANTKYFLVVQCASDGVDSSNYVRIVATWPDNDDPGNFAEFANSAWSTAGSGDLNYVLYTESELTITAYDVTSTFSTGNDGWVNFTYADPDGYEDLKTCTIQVNTTGDAETFTLVYTQATDSFAETVDVDSMCTLSVYSDFVAVDAYHGTVAFKFRISDLATQGECDVKVTFVEDDDNELITAYNALFEFLGIEWGPVGDIIDSAFNVFGITGFMTSLITFITGLASSFTNALNYTLLLVLQMYNLVTSTFMWSIGWVTRMITIMTTLVTLVITLINGTYVGVGALTDIWALFEFSEWGFEFLPIIVLVQWFESLDKRHTKGADYFSTAYNDLNVVYGVVSFFFTWISFVANTVVDYVMTFVQSLSQVV